MTHSRNGKFSGIYRSTYVYHSSARDQDLTSETYARMYEKDDDLIIESVPEVNESYFLARFSIDGNIATGAWQNSTSPKGDYQGTLYHGAAQLIISEDGKRLKGQWVGYGKNMEVKTGPWEFEYVGEDVSAITKKAAEQ